ncbi:MAG: hypothetical protein JXR91_16095 [Deltaproteobacteria bacterium]|nr:hypothetical protein [Deltaproteobacteria bacterium]
MFKTAVIGLFLSMAFNTASVQADCRGCCSNHKGVVCRNGITECQDGTPLSFKCESKGCNKCGGTNKKNKN